MKIEIYGNCAKCNYLSRLLKNEKIKYTHITDERVEEFANKKGLIYAPIVVIDGEVIEYMTHPMMYFRYIEHILREGK